MTAPIPQTEAEALMDEAWELLEAGETEQAMAIGRRLERGRFSGGFEIQALAYQDMGKNKKAIRVLEKGTKTVADVWVLWQLLGNCLSDDGSYDEALAAYETALGLPHADEASLRYNRANVLCRAGRLDEAKEIVGDLLEGPSFALIQPELQLCIRTAQIGILNDLELYQEAIAQFEAFPRPADWSKHSLEAAGLETRYAVALWYDGRLEDAREAVDRAIRFDKTNEEVQWLVREMRQCDEGASSIYYTLLIQGPWRADSFPQMAPVVGFFTTYQVVADGLDEALFFVREFEPAEIRGALRIEEVEAQEPCGEPKGVYWTSGYDFYEED